MPANITDVSVFTTPVVVPVDGDLVSGADRTLDTQALANRTRYLRDRVLGAEDESFVILPLCCAHSSPFSLGGSQLWSFFHNTIVSLWVNADVSNVATLVLDVTPYIPVGVTVTQVRAFLSSAWGGPTHTGLPATLPKVFFHEWDPNSPYMPTYTATGTDPSVSAGAYNAEHVIAPAVSRLISPFKRYTIELTGETGTNSVASATGCYNLDISFTAP